MVIGYRGNLTHSYPFDRIFGLFIFSIECDASDDSVFGTTSYSISNIIYRLLI